MIANTEVGMYTLIKAVKRKTQFNGKWEVVDLSGEILEGIYERLGWVVVELKAENATNTNWINLINLETFFKNNESLTFDQWLTSIGDQLLPFNPEPWYPKEYAKYVQAWHAGYQFQPVHASIHPNATISPYEKSDLIVTHQDITSEYLGHYGLFSVNGLFHFSDFGHEQFRIVDGFKSILKYKNNQIGLLSFEQLGKIRCLPIDETYLTKVNDESNYWDNTFITIPEHIDLTNKSLFFVLGGYIHFPSSDITAVSGNSYSIKFNNILTIERYFQLNERLNLKEWGLMEDSSHPSLVDVNRLFSDETVIKLLTMSQSYIVIVDSPRLYQTTEPVEYIKFPGRYVDRTANKLPLMGVHGVGLDYHTIKEDIVTVLAASNNQRENYIANTLNWTKANYLDNGRYPFIPKVDETAYYRIIHN